MGELALQQFEFCFSAAILFHQRFCNGAVADLFCNTGEFLNTVQAWYGGLSCNNACSFFDTNSATCGSDITSKIQDMCRLLPECNVSVTDAVLGSPVGCGPNDHNLFVWYDCCTYIFLKYVEFYSRCTL